MIQVSPIRIQDGSTQAVVMALFDKACDCPSLLIDFGGRKLSVRLPIFVTRFIEAVEMPEAAFPNNWEAITHKQPDTFQKIDMIIKNPAPPHVPIATVIVQLQNFLSSAMGFKVYATSEGVRAVGQVVTRPAAQTSFPKNPAEMAPQENVPVMLEAQFYEESKEELRLSLRAANNKVVASHVLAFIKFFMNV